MCARRGVLVHSSVVCFGGLEHIFWYQLDTDACNLVAGSLARADRPPIMEAVQSDLGRAAVDMMVSSTCCEL